MKTSAKQTITKIALGSLFSLICFVGAIHAQPSLLAETNFHEPDMEVEEWMIDQDAFNSSYQESNLEIESWMTDFEAFDNTQHEPLLTIEDWMTDTEAFDNIYTEELLAIEDWMTDPDDLKNSSHEPLLALEDWMSDMDLFFDYFQPNTKMLFTEVTEEPIKLESWMSNVNDFLAGPIHKLHNINSIDLNEFSPIMMALHISSK